MKTTISIKTKRSNTNIKADNYLVVGTVGDKLEMMTNLQRDDLLMFLMPLLEELNNNFSDDYCPMYNN